jgi:hypothetical protein
MSRWTNGFFALVAALLAFGAVHLEIASGTDLKALTRGDASLFGSRGIIGAPTDVISAPTAVASAVNRAAKADRIGPAAPSAGGPTIVFTLAGLDNTSVATFLPAPQRPARPAQQTGPQAIAKTAACEPPVSALAEAARLLVTGRCIT